MASPALMKSARSRATKAVFLARTLSKRGLGGKKVSVTGLMLEKLPPKKELEGEFDVSIKSNEKWNPRHIVFTKKIIAFSNQDDDNVIDVIPLHEVEMIRDMSLFNEIADDGSEFNGTTNSDEETAASAEPNKNQFQIETKKDGYNSGRSYLIEANSVQEFRVLFDDLTKLSSTAREEAEAKSRFKKTQDKFGKVFNSDFVQRLLAILIFGNFFANVVESQIGVSLDNSDTPYAQTMRTMFDYLNLAFTALFSAELFCNMFVHWFSPFINNGWNILDVVMILISWFALVVKTSGVNVVRLIRVFRVVRVFGKFPSLRRIIVALTSCVVPMIGAFSVLIIFICLYSILGVSLFGDKSPEFFESFDRSFMTLFRIAGGNAWDSYLIEQFELNGTPEPGFSIFLVSFVMLISWVLLQITTVVLLDSFMKASTMLEHDEDTRSRAKKATQEESVNPLEPLLKKLSEDFTDDQDLHARLEKLFKVLDADKSGCLSAQEFTASMRKLNFHPWIHVTPTDFESFTRHYQLCNENNSLEFDGFEAVMREQLQRYSLSRLSKSVGRSPVELSLAQFGVLKVMMMELLKTKLEQVAVHKDISALLQTVKELPDVIARKGDGAAMMWGPDGGDLFEQMCRPICARVSEMMQPIQDELQDLRDIVSAGEYGPPPNGRRDGGSRAYPATTARAAARTARADARAAEEAQSTLQGWTQGLKNIAEWVQIGGAAAQPAPPRRDWAQEGGERRAVIAGALAEPANDLVIINDGLADGSAVSADGGRGRAPTVTITASAVSTSDIVSLRSEMDGLGGSRRSTSPALWSTEQSAARNGGFGGQEPGRGRRPVPAPAMSASSARDAPRPRSPPPRPSAQSYGPNPVSVKSEASSRADRHAGKQPAASASEDRYGSKPRPAIRAKEPDGSYPVARTLAERPPYSVDSQPSQPGQSRRAGMPLERSGRGVQEGKGRGAKGSGPGYG